MKSNIAVVVSEYAFQITGIPGRTPLNRELLPPGCFNANLRIHFGQLYSPGNQQPSVLRVELRVSNKVKSPDTIAITAVMMRNL